MERSPGAQPDLRSVVDALWRRRWLFLGILVSIPVVVYLVSTRIVEKYETDAIVSTAVQQFEVPGVSTGALSSSGSEEVLINSEEVKAAAAEELGGSVGGSIAAEPLTTTGGTTTGLLQLTATAGSGQRAADIADAYASAIDKVRTRESVKAIDRAMAKLEAQADEVTDPATDAEIASQLQSLRAARGAARESTETILAARVPDSPISPNPKRNTALAAVVALLLALGIVVVRERLDRRLRDPDELEPLLGTPLLSVIPNAAFPGARPADTTVREAFRTLAASLVYFNIDRPLASVMVASPTKGDGKTTVAVYLAIALARDGQNVVLIDADMRHPRVAVRLGIESEVGLSDVLSNQAELNNALIEIDVGDGRLRVLASGSRPPNPARLLSSRRVGSLLASLSEQVDIVIIDTPPLLTVSDAVPLLEKVSGTIVVAKVGSTSRDALERMRQVIETAAGNNLGAVATGSGKAGLYGYGAEYYEEDVRVEEPAPIVDRKAAAAEAGDPSVGGENGRGDAVSPGASEHDQIDPTSEPIAQRNRDARDSGA
jgi:capsular exopolysaccharide synthesis family protein